MSDTRNGICFGVAMVIAICVLDSIKTIPEISAMLPACHQRPLVLLCQR